MRASCSSRVEELGSTCRTVHPDSWNTEFRADSKKVLLAISSADISFHSDSGFVNISATLASGQAKGAK